MEMGPARTDGQDLIVYDRIQKVGLESPLEKSTFAMVDLAGHLGSRRGVETE